MNKLRWTDNLLLFVLDALMVLLDPDATIRILMVHIYVSLKLFP